MILTLSTLRPRLQAATGITDAALDYLTYYTRFPEANTAGVYGVAGLQWLELSNTRITDVGVGKLVAVLEDGKPFGKARREAPAAAPRCDCYVARIKCPLAKALLALP